MSVPQSGPAHRGSPVTLNYRGVTSPVQQYGPNRPPEVNQGGQRLRGPSPAPGFRPSSPARLNYQSPRSSQQHLPRDRPRPGPGHTRSQSAIVPSSSGYVIGSSQRPKAPSISVSGPQARPASFHTTTPSTMDQRSNGVYLQQKAPRQPTQQTTRGTEWVPGVIPRQNLQQSHAQFMALEKEFQNLVKSSSPNHSRHDSFDSAISTRSSYSRPSVRSPSSRAASSIVANQDLQSATSQASSGPADTKDAPLHGARRNYTSSPLAKPTRPSVDTTASSNGPTHINGPPTTAVPSSKKHTRGESKSSRLRRVLSIASLDDVSKSSDSVTESHDGKNTRWGGGDGGQEHGRERPHTPNREHGIYGSNIFSRSLESIAASTKASSASAMLKKVGSGVKRGSRSLSGLFRPKSPSPLITEVSQPVVSMVTVEAETPLVKGPLPPKVSEAFPVIGLGSPKSSLEHEIPKIPERNRGDSLSPPKDPRAISMGLIRGTSPIPKGILKGSASPDLRPTSRKEAPTFFDVLSSPSPSVPSTPTNETQDSRMLNPFLTSDLTSDLDGLMEALNRVNGIDEPIEAVQAVQVVHKPKHHTSFSPRLVFYDTWTPEEYDRRGEVATCNLLTPKLAQQIKDEINTFKMEMDVHETSKMYTQFH